MRSLVKKDAGMLDAFGKGASEDIRAAKAELYAQMTWDPMTSQSLNTPPQITTPMPSPPPSPKTDSALHKANSGGATCLCPLVPILSYKSTHKGNVCKLTLPFASFWSSLSEIFACVCKIVAD